MRTPSLLLLLPLPRDLHVGPNVNITGRDTRRAKENVSTVTTSASNLDRVRAAVGGGVVKGNNTTRVTVRCVDRPCGLIPPAFEVVRDLGKREGKESKGEKSSLAQHYCE